MRGQFLPLSYQENTLAVLDLLIQDHSGSQSSRRYFAQLLGNRSGLQIEQSVEQAGLEFIMPVAQVGESGAFARELIS